MGVLDEFPFPFHKAAGNDLWRTLVLMVPSFVDATQYAAQVDPNIPGNLPMGPGTTTSQLWHAILEVTAQQNGHTRALVQAVLARVPNSHKAALLRGLLAEQPVLINPQPFDELPITQPEALLFTDDLTMPAGRVPALVATLQRLHMLATAVCLLRVVNVLGQFGGTGFRIGPDLVLTNHHVLFPEGRQATAVHADFGVDVDASNRPVLGPSQQGDVASIVTDRADDWAVIRVPGMNAAIATVDLSTARVPAEGGSAYIIQHPDGRPKRLGFVRNTITQVTNDRVLYVTDTQPGSSGSPVFDDSGVLVALHHRGGAPIVELGKVPMTKNQGVRIDRVVAGMQARGVAI